MSRLWLYAFTLGGCVLAATIARAAPDGPVSAPLDRTAGRATTEVAGTVSAAPPKLGRYVVVYFENAPRVPGRGTHATIDQKNIAFVPRLTVVSPGATVTFLNSDPVVHNVFSPDPKRFDLGKIAPGARASRVFNVVGRHTLLCNLHPGMIAYVFVAPSGYYTVADEKGHYRIPDVPNGSYRITAWAPKLPPRTLPVRLSGGSARINFHLHR